MLKKKFYTLIMTIKTENERIRYVYEGYQRIRFRYNKKEKTVRAVLIDSERNKTVLEKVNVESVEKRPY